MIRIYTLYTILGKKEDVEAFEEVVTQIAEDYDVVLSGDFRDEDGEIGE